MADDSIRGVSEALDVLRTRGLDAAVAYLHERLDIGEGQAREILAIAAAPDPRALAGRI
jgi:hypothetical protein